MINIAFGNKTGETLSLTFTVEIPQSQTLDSLSEEKLLEARNIKRGLACDIIGSFTDRLVASIERRMKACQTKLLNHIENAKSYNGVLISWSRKDGSEDHFNVPSFEAMKSAIKTLKSGSQWSFLQDRIMVDQAIKALLNDPEQDHSDAGGFRYSELVSVLMEHHNWVG